MSLTVHRVCMSAAQPQCTVAKVYDDSIDVVKSQHRKTLIES